MFERNSLRLTLKGKRFYYQAEELQSQEVADRNRYVILFPSLKKVRDFDKTSRNAHMTIRNYFGSYHQVVRISFEFHRSSLKNLNDENLYSGLLTVQEVDRKG